MATHKHCFGHQDLCQALVKRIEDHSQQGSTRHTVDPSLIIGVMNHWGGGKSEMLHAIGTTFKDRLEGTEKTGDVDKTDEVSKGTSKNPQFSIISCCKPLFYRTTFFNNKVFRGVPKSLIIPITFNAWRYEREPNLIAPLLKTTQHNLQESILQSKKTTGFLQKLKGGIKDQVRDKFKAITDFLGKATKAMASASQVELSVKLNSSDILTHLLGFSLPKGKGPESTKGMEATLKLRINPKDAIAALENKKDTQETPSASVHQNPDESSIYYDFGQQLETLSTAKGEGVPNLYLLFLIDDLDRCLPEKALEMLEVIKLFFNVTHCGFVLALDDEEMMSACLVLWQLFAPELYRYCHAKPLRFALVADLHAADTDHTHLYAEHDQSKKIAWLKAIFPESNKNYSSYGN
jgi:hypothetical protein